MDTLNLEEKEKEVNDQFNKEKAEAVDIEEQIKVLQARYQEKMANIMRLQGAFALLKELKNSPKKEEKKPEKKKKD